MLNHILIPLDGSPLAENAIVPAKLILNPKAKLLLVSVIETPERWDFGTAPGGVFEEAKKIPSHLLAQAKVYLEKIATDLRREDFLVETIALYGEAAAIIVDTASAHKVEAICMSTHGRSGFSRWLFGSVTGKVLSAAPCPVYVIPSKHHLPQADDTAVVDIH